MRGSVIGGAFSIAQGLTMRTQSRAQSEGSDFSDVELVDRLLRRAPGAFELFYSRHERLIYHCIRARADPSDVADLFQGFFERLVEGDYRVLRLWQRGTSLPIYLSRVIRNFVIDFHRTKRRRETPVGGLSELEAHEPEGEETLTTAIVLKELRRIGLQAWAKLDSRDRFLMCGKLHRELTNEAMAERLNLTSGALRTAVSRAQARLLASLKILAPEYFPAKV
jgi:RNA polymerase sigma factor (sigma-70 family)